MSEEQEDLDELYPPTDEEIIVVSGSVSSGFKYWGPFDSMSKAVEWVESLHPFIGYTHITYVNKPEDFPVKVCKDDRPE